MRIACSIESFVDHSPTEVLDLVHAVGFRAIALEVSSRAPERDDRAASADVTSADAFVREITRRDLGVAAVAGRNVSFEIPAYVRDAESVLASASKLGAATVLLPSRDSPGASDWNEWLRAVCRMGDRAASMRMTISLDFRDAAYSHGRSMLEVVQAVDHPAVGLCFDTGRYLHDNPASSGEIALQRVCGHMSFLRLSDHSSCESDEDFPALGDAGGVDFARTFEIVRNFGFNGPCAMWLRPRHAGRASPAKWQSWLEHSLQHLERCGWPVNP